MSSSFHASRRFWSMPHTDLGRACVILGALAFGFFVVANVAVAGGHGGGDTLSANWWIASPMLAAGASVIAGAILGTLALSRGHDRSWAVVLTTALGALATVFVAGELLAPH